MAKRILDNAEEFFDSLTDEEFDELLNELGFKYETKETNSQSK